MPVRMVLHPTTGTRPRSSPGSWTGSRSSPTPAICRRDRLRVSRERVDQGAQTCTRHRQHRGGCWPTIRASPRSRSVARRGLLGPLRRARHADDEANLAQAARGAGRRRRSSRRLRRRAGGDRSRRARELHGRGELRGTLAREPRGTGGIRLRPRVHPRGREPGRSPRCPRPRRIAISHRARAAAALRAALAERSSGEADGLGHDGSSGPVVADGEPPVDLGAEHDDVRHAGRARPAGSPGRRTSAAR